ncbi:DUF6543 domain-containing protein [Pseudomonas citrulli]|uniref:Type III effector 1 n=1 Tax=Pseudomonas citrulli TaxID=3064347 RepID=A0ABT9C0V4_9PSED|nr:DUF6543 domain-containing protein [Pseudomonas sp. K18]MDO7898413.1 type III effector 1 [Pseudomonas sp. K18]
MDNTTRQQRDGSAAGTPTFPGEAAHAVVLERLARWQAAVDARLQAQMSLLQVLEEYLLVELRTRYYEGNIDPHFIDTLLDTVLQRLVDSQPLAYDASLDEPFRWPGAADRSLGAERREALVQVVEGTASAFIGHYKNYLARHWRALGPDPALQGLIKQKLEEHLAAIDRLFQPEHLAGLGVDGLREKIEALEDAWRQMSRLTALATAQERRRLGAIARAQLPDWLGASSAQERTALRTLAASTRQAQEQVDALLDGLGSLRSFARALIRDFVRHERDMEVEPDSIRIQLQWRTVAGQPVQAHYLSELMAAGPIRPDAVAVLLVENASQLRNQPLSPAFISSLLASVDAPAGYGAALLQCYNRADFKDAMLDWFMARLQQSAFIARCAGHMTVSQHESLRALWEHDAAFHRAPALRVASLVLPRGLQCAELLLFYRETASGEVSDPLLYAPGKPDGQEWIGLASLRAVNALTGAWTQDEAGRQYLLQQLAPSARGEAQAFFSRVTAKPTSWDLNGDPRGVPGDLHRCLQAAVLASLAHHLAEVRLQPSPRWYAALPLESRREISSLSQALRIHRQVFDERMAGYEVFVDFARRTVAQAIAPYLRSKGVLEPVDPATVLIDYRPGLAGDNRVANLLDLVIHGYDDNWGIDDPAKGVRSSVGQDLGRVRSADLGSYIRRAYVGERYVREIRARFLDARSPDYVKRRDAFRDLLLARLDHDLRVAYGQAQVNADELRWLTRQVSLLSDGPPGAGAVHPGAAVTREGIIRFTLAGHVVSGLYVFVYFDPGARYWLYTPEAPDGILFRPYLNFGRVAAQLQDYVMARVALSARAAVTRTLQALAAAPRGVDTLRELNRVSDPNREFDAGIERAIADVEDVTTGRAEVIRDLVFKGLAWAAVPVCMVYPPFVLWLDIAFVGLSAGRAVQAHVRGDTHDALGRWLAASWGLLFATLGPWAVAGLTGWMERTRLLARGSGSLLSLRLRSAAASVARETGPMIQPVRFKPRQAARTPAGQLQQVTEEGLYHGTYLSPPSLAQPRSTYYIHNRGRYYQVAQDPYFGGLCLVDASRPGALYRLPIRRLPNGRWVRNPVGLKGGNDDVLNLGRVADLREAFPGHARPNIARGALQGEALVARSGTSPDDYLFSLNAQSCVIASLYNPSTRAGAVIHFDHNVRSLVERSVRDVLQRLGGTAKDIRATLVGGDWLTGADIGGRIRAVMRREGLQPTWDHWSYSSCLGNTYGVALDLRSGVTSVFKTSGAQVQEYYIPLLARAPRGTDRVAERARRFMARMQDEIVVENARGVVLTQQGQPAPDAWLERYAFSMVVVG